MDEENRRSETKPLVSIITPCYNGEEHGMLPDYFEGIMSQTYENIELIFVNDGSTDNTEEIYFEYEPKLNDSLHDTKYIRFEENKGVIAGTNAALDNVSGKFICYFDSDDIMLPHLIESQVEFLQKNEEYGMVYSDGYIVEKDNLEEPLRTFFEEREPKSGDIFEKLLTGEAFVPSGTYVFRSKCLNDLPKLKNEFSSRGQNAQILYHISYHYKIGYNDVSPVMKYVVRPDSLAHSLDLENLYFKTFVVGDLIKYMIDKYGASTDTRKRINVRFKRKEVLYYFFARDGEKLRNSYQEFKDLCDHTENKMIKKKLMYYITLIYGLSFFTPFWRLLSSSLMKTEFAEKMFYYD